MAVVTARSSLASLRTILKPTTSTTLAINAGHQTVHGISKNILRKMDPEEAVLKSLMLHKVRKNERSLADHPDVSTLSDSCYVSV